MSSRRILLGLDGSSGSFAALDWCREYAPALDAEVVAVFVVDVRSLVGFPALDPSMGRVSDDANLAVAHRLEGWVQAMRDAGIPCRTQVIAEEPADGLDGAAVEHDCDLIVVGRRARGGLGELLLGSVPHALAHHSHRPLVIVPVPDQPPRNGPTKQ